MRIGIFDSGLGGLITLREIIKKLPQHDYIYLGDNARAPYGNRSAEIVHNFTLQAVDFLFKQDCQLIIIACNTATAAALRKIQQEWLPFNYPDRRVLGVTRPLAEAAFKINADKIGVIGTKGTINSQVFIKELEKLGYGGEIFQQAAPLLVPIIEDSAFAFANASADDGLNLIISELLNQYLEPLKKQNVSTLILGCTHYPILIEQIKNIMGEKVNVLNSGEVIADSLADYLQRHNVTLRLPKCGPQVMVRQAHHDIKFYVTDLSDNYQKIGEQWFGPGIKFEKIELK